MKRTYKTKALANVVAILLDYAIKIKASNKNAFEQGALCSKIKHYITIINKVDSIIDELKK